MDPAEYANRTSRALRDSLADIDTFRSPVAWDAVYVLVGQFAYNAAYLTVTRTDRRNSDKGDKNGRNRI